MSERKPLTTLHNGCSARQKVQRTYGRKGKTSAALGFQDCLTMSDEIEKKLVLFSISETEGQNDQENQQVPELVEENGGAQVSAAGSRMATRSTVSAKRTTMARSKIPTTSKAPATSRVPATSRTSARSKRPATSKAPETSKASIKAGKSSTDSTKLKLNLSYYSDGTSIHPEVLKFSNTYSRTGVTNFEEFGATLSQKYTVIKVGEGAFSSVFALHPKDITGSPTNNAPNPGNRGEIFKLMPISPSSEEKVEGGTIPAEIANEIEVMKATTDLHGFLDFRGVSVVMGDWPDNFADAFRVHKMKNKKNAQNEDPEYYGAHQCYAILQMGDAGNEVNTITRPSIFQIYDIFWQTAIHLASAESHVQFEHRDLHVSNLCFKGSDGRMDRLDVALSTIADMKEHPKAVLGMSNLNVTIIDYTFARLTTPAATAAPPDTEPKIIFRDCPELDRNHAELIAEHGSEDQVTPDKQYEDTLQEFAYTKLTDCVKAATTGQEDPPLDMWRQHVPRTNTCWLVYLLGCLMHRSAKGVRTRYVLGSNRVSMALQDEMRGRLEEMQMFLVTRGLDELPDGANGVVSVGLKCGWLTVADVDSYRERTDRDS